MWTLLGSSSAALEYASSASLVWLLHDSYCDASAKLWWETRQKPYQCAQVVPDFRNVRVESYCARVRIQRVSILVDLVVQDTDGAPERWVSAVAVHSLLVSFIGFRVLLL